MRVRASGLVAALLCGALGCAKEAAEVPAAPAEPAGQPAPPAAPPPAAAEAPVPIPADFEPAVSAAITPENYVQALELLEREIEAE
jgi:colicin import membrane protein